MSANFENKGRGAFSPSVAYMIEVAFNDALMASSLDPAKAVASVSEIALENLVKYQKSREQVTNFCPNADYFFDLRDKLGANKTQFHAEANREVSTNSGSALAAALVGVQLTPENRALAVKQLTALAPSLEINESELFGFSFQERGGA